MNIDELDRMLAEPPVDIASLSTNELRSQRTRYQRAESGVSYVRRILQGKLDIVTAELDLRADHESDAGDAVVSRVGSALSQHGRGPGLARPPQDLQPPEFVGDLMGRLDVDDHDVSEVAELSDDDLREMASRLQLAESTTTATRRQLHEIIDGLHAETISRYQKGDTSVDELLGAE